MIDWLIMQRVTVSEAVKELPAVKLSATTISAMDPSNHPIHRSTSEPSTLDRSVWMLWRPIFVFVSHRKYFLFEYVADVQCVSCHSVCSPSVSTFSLKWCLLENLQRKCLNVLLQVKGEHTGKTCMNKANDQHQSGVILHFYIVNKSHETKSVWTLDVEQTSSCFSKHWSNWRKWWDLLGLFSAVD